MAAVAKRGGFGSTTTAGPDGTIFFNCHHLGSLARALMGTIAVGRVFALPAGAESERLTGCGVDFIRKGLPAHEWIIGCGGKKESGNCGKYPEKIADRS